MFRQKKDKNKSKCVIMLYTIQPWSCVLPGPVRDVTSLCCLRTVNYMSDCLGLAMAATHTKTRQVTCWSLEIWCFPGSSWPSRWGCRVRTWRPCWCPSPHWCRPPHSTGWWPHVGVSRLHTNTVKISSNKLQICPRGEVLSIFPNLPQLLTPIGDLSKFDPLKIHDLQMIRSFEKWPF